MDLTAESTNAVEEQLQSERVLHRFVEEIID
jgi:hypothetical protein